VPLHARADQLEQAFKFKFKLFIMFKLQVLLALVLGAAMTATGSASWIRIAPPAQTGLVSCNQGYQL
jgi:hypothetical protein